MRPLREVSRGGCCRTIAHARHRPGPHEHHPPRERGGADAVEGDDRSVTVNYDNAVATVFTS
jgi:hypothetical protein